MFFNLPIFFSSEATLHITLSVCPSVWPWCYGGKLSQMSFRIDSQNFQWRFLLRICRSCFKLYWFLIFKYLISLYRLSFPLCFRLRYLWMLSSLFMFLQLSLSQWKPIRFYINVVVFFCKRGNSMIRISPVVRTFVGDG